MPTRRIPANLAARYLAFLFAIFTATNVCAQNSNNLKPQGYVNDFANVLSAAAKQKLTALCAEVDQKAGAQIAVVTVPSLNGQEIEDYSVALATKWGIGPKEKSRGVMILFAPTEHKYRFEVGYGLEGILPDGRVGGFGREAVPLLRQNNYEAAILLMTQRVAQVIAADKSVTLDALSGVPPQPRAQSSGRSSESGITFREIVFGIFVLFFLFRLIFGRSNYGRRGGGGSGWWIGPMIGGSMGGGGRSWGGGGSGGGGFGGFGGGSFGGGGASGSW